MNWDTFGFVIRSQAIARHMRQNPALATSWKARRYWTDDDLRAHLKAALDRRRSWRGWLIEKLERITEWLKK